jgi:hypothetical protein
MKLRSVKPTNRSRLVFAACALIISGSLFGRVDGQALTATTLPPERSTVVPPDVMIRYVPGPLITKQAYDPPQILAMQDITWATVATTDRRCDAMFKMAPGAANKMATDDTLTDLSAASETMAALRAVYAAYYDIPSNQEPFCKYTLERFGPTSMYNHLVNLK